MGTHTDGLTGMGKARCKARRKPQASPALDIVRVAKDAPQRLLIEQHVCRLKSATAVEPARRGREVPGSISEALNAPP